MDKNRELKQVIMITEIKNMKLIIKMTNKMVKELISMKMEINQMNFSWKMIKFMEFILLTIKMELLKRKLYMKKTSSLKTCDDYYI